MRVTRLRKDAGLKHQATPKELRYSTSRGLRAEQRRELLNGHYIIHKKNLLITGSDRMRQELPRYFIRTPYNGVLASQTRHDYCPQSSMIRG